MRWMLLLIAAFCASACFCAEGAKNETWEAAMNAALEKAKAGDYAAIMDTMLAPEFAAKLKEKHGADAWKEKFEARLKRIHYYYGKLKDAKVETSGNKTTVRGEYGCWAEFYKVDGVFLIGDFGQVITSM